MSNTATSTLPHAAWCKAGRVETTDHPEQGVTTTHCVDCGAHEAKDRAGEHLPTPAVTGGLVAHGRGDMDVTLDRAPATRVTSAPWPAHADNLKEF